MQHGRSREIHCFEVERKEADGKKNKESLDAKVECLKKELLDYKAGRKGDELLKRSCF